MTRIESAIVGLAGLTLVSACGQNSRPETRELLSLTSAERLAQLELGIPGLMDNAGVTGLSITVTVDTGIVWSRGFGVADAADGKPVSDTSVFEAASLSKPVFAYAVLQLVDQELIDLDTPIADYYEYEAIAHDDRHRQITPRMVLTHSTGFPNWRPRGGQLTIGFEPGSEFSYSGEGFVYLQRAVMNLLDEPLDQLARRLVFDPLGMTNSSYLWRESFEDVVALPHGSEGETLRKHRPQAGSGNAAASLHTTAPDYARFVLAVMHGTGLSDSTAAAMLESQIVVDSGVTWGLGIGLQDNAYGRGFWHWGDNTGYKAYAIAYPEHGVGVVWFTNSENGQSLLEGMLALTVRGDNPAARWLDYEQYDSPKRMVREELEQVFEDHGVAAAISRYHEMKPTRPAEAFDEFLLNTLGYRMLRADQLQEAIAIFELNVAEYSEASNPYDSLGEALLAAGDTARAIENYQRSLELDPDNTNAAAVLERLRGP
jgi:CubicO group peptidase (beta-lactamase class C family)